MKRFLGIFATALLFLFLFTFFGGSYFLDIQHHFYAWMFPVSLASLRHLGVLAAGRQSRGPAKAGGRAGSRPAENRRSQIKKQSSTQRRLCGAFVMVSFGQRETIKKESFYGFLRSPALPSGSCGKPNT
mgnify:CR=1 FL=1